MNTISNAPAPHALLVMGILLALALLFIGTISFAVGYSIPPGGGRTPVPPTPPAPPVQVPCPTSFYDDIALSNGGASNALIDQALGAAVAACQDDQSTNDYPDQEQELREAREKCEAVPGCHLTWGSDIQFCEGNLYLDCIPPPGIPGTSYACSVRGYVDYTNYECTRGPGGS